MIAKIQMNKPSNQSSNQFIKHYNITVKGKVQRVSFRFTTHALALKLGLSGFVRNMSNGNVYMEVEGIEDHINKLIDWCQVGPPKADIKEVQAVEAELKNFSSFEIKR